MMRMMRKGNYPTNMTILYTGKEEKKNYTRHERIETTNYNNKERETKKY